MSNDGPDDITRTYVQLADGSVVAHYRIIEKIGAGGMGEVYLAEDTELNRRVALKFLPSHLCLDEEYRTRFRREAQAAAKLNHPNIVTIHEVGDYGGHPYIVSEYVGEQTLKDVIRYKQVDPGEAINIIMEVCEGLQEAHAAGIVHRDIKPGNIVLEKHNRPKIVDFGLAFMAGTGSITRTGSTMGTIAYMSPEQLKGKTADHRSDLFAVGMVLYELITGRNPFAADHDAAVQYLILSEQPEPLARFKAGVPDGLQEIVDRTLEKDPAVRYQSAADLIADLRRLRRRSADSDPDGRSSGQADTGRRKTGRFALAGVGLIALAGMLWVVLRPDLGSVPSRHKHLAVLPLVSLGEAGAGQTLCDGLAETITSKLTQLAEFEGRLRVVPSSEVRGSNIRSAGQARRTFGVGLVVTGSVQEHGGAVRLTLNLVDTRSQRQLRSTVIDEKVSDISRWQDLVVTELAQMLDIQLRPDSRRLLAAGRTSSSEAYYAYLRGRGYLQRSESATCLDSAALHFEAAIKEDSAYALAYAGLGEVYFQRYNLTMDIQWVTPALVHSTRALELNDHLAPVLVTLGTIHRGTGQYQEATRYLRQAIQFDSLNNAAYRELALAYESLGRETDAESCYTKAVHVQPDDWRNYYYLSLFNIARGGHRDEAVQQAAQAEELAPDASYPCAFLGGLYVYLGMTDKAKTLLKRAIDLEPDYFAYSNLGAIYQVEKDYQNAAAMYEQALRLRSSDYRVWINLGSIYQMLPQGKERALAAFDSAIIRAEQNRKINPKDAMLLVHLADCYAKVGDRDKAIELAGQAVRLAPGAGEVLVRASLIHETLGRRDEALDLLGRAIRRGYSEGEIRKIEEFQALLQDRRFDSVLSISRPRRGS
ncbi:MAG: protein kinase [Candidatus Zixiibacteriota bacterium]